MLTGSTNTVLWSNGYDTCFTRRKRWFDSIQDYFFKTPRYANWQSDSAQYQFNTGPECLQVRPLLWVLKSLKAANQQRCNFLFLHETNGALVQREDVCVASRRSGFDSLVLHSVESTWLGRQLADHFGLEPEMLWVRVPPELLKPYAGVVSNG